MHPGDADDLQGRLEEIWPVGTSVTVREMVTPRGRVFPAYEGTVTGHTPGYVIVRSSETRRRRCHTLGELRRLESST